MLWERDFEDKKNWKKHNNFGDFFIIIIFKDESSTYAQISIQTWVIQSKRTISAKTKYFYDNKIFYDDEIFFQSLITSTNPL